MKTPLPILETSPTCDPLGSPLPVEFSLSLTVIDAIEAIIVEGLRLESAGVHLLLLPHVLTGSLALFPGKDSVPNRFHQSHHDLFKRQVSGPAQHRL